MPAFLDARCPKCDKKIGWWGKVSDRPRCDRCGHQVPKADLEAADRQMEAMEAEMIAEMDRPKNNLRQRRTAAGLTLHDAAILIGVSLTQVSKWERGEGEPTAEQVKLIDEAYGAGQCPDARKSC